MQRKKQVDFCGKFFICVAQKPHNVPFYFILVVYMLKYEFSEAKGSGLNPARHAI